MTVAAMQAGREMDAKVAEIMGTLEWEWVIEGTSRSEVFATVEEAMAAKPALERHYLVGDLVLGSSVPDYSTNIAAAWDVMGSLAGRGWWPTVGISQTGGWSCTVWHGPDDVRRGIWPIADWSADTAPLAICRAALAALRVLEPYEPHA